MHIELCTCKFGNGINFFGSFQTKFDKKKSVRATEFMSLRQQEMWVREKANKNFNKQTNREWKNDDNNNKSNNSYQK